MKKIWLLLVITLFAAFLRFYNLGSNPPSLNLDEVAIGYNAYSILNTGMDEYGTRFPIAFRSHDDYKAPLYIYATTLAVAIFGLNEFAVRFFSALMGTLTIPLTYFLTKELVADKKKFSVVPLLSALFIAISPWHLQFSRASFETNVAIFFIIGGIWAFLKGLKHRNYWFLTSISFALSLYTYHSAKLFIPIFTLLLIWIARKEILKNFRFSVVVALVFVILVGPLIPFSLSPEGRLRFKGTSVFETPTMIDFNHDLKLDQWRAGREYTAKVFHSEFLAGIQVVLRGYFSHFSYEFLFHGESGPPKNYTPNVGLLYIWELPLIFVGLYALFRHDFKYKGLFLTWLFLVPVASALTWDVPSSTRTTIILPSFQILSALGIIQLIIQTKSLLVRKLTYGLISFVVLFFFLHYMQNYHRIAPTIHSDAWQYGYKQAALYAGERESDFDKIIVSNRLKQPQNHFAFYLKYDPQTYIEIDGGTRSGGFEESNNAFGKYEFRPISWDEKDLQPRTLYIDIAEFVDHRFEPIHQINLLNGEPILTLYHID